MRKTALHRRNLISALNLARTNNERRSLFVLAKQARRKISLFQLAPGADQVV